MLISVLTAVSQKRAMKISALIRGKQTPNFSVGDSALLFMASEIFFTETREICCVE
jgi:hypothetical protein